MVQPSMCVGKNVGTHQRSKKQWVSTFCSLRTHLALECSRSVFKELLPPAIEDGRLEMIFITDRRDGHLIEQVLSQDDDLFFGAIVFAVYGAQDFLHSD